MPNNIKHIYCDILDQDWKIKVIYDNSEVYYIVTHDGSQYVPRGWKSDNANMIIDLINEHVAHFFILGRQ